MKKPVAIYLCTLMAAGLLLGVPGCEEKEVPFVIDSDEIATYVQQSPEARELFRTDGLFPTEPYEVSHQDAVYRDVVLSHERTIDVSIVPLRNPITGEPTPDEQLYADYGSLGRLREAWASVRDEFEIETTRIFASDTIVDTTDRRFNRFGFFLKLGSDYQTYVGWVLYGFNGLGSNNAPLSVVVRAVQDGADTTFSGNLILYRDISRTVTGTFGVKDYIKMLNIVQIDNGDSVTIGTQWGGSPTINKRDYPLITVDGTSGPVTTTLNQIFPNPRDKYGGTVDLKDGSTNRYDFIFLQSLHDDEFFVTGVWCIPYRLF